MNEASQPRSDNTNNTTEKLDPIATLLFLVFICALGYLLIASSFGIYPWAILLEEIWFIPSWDAVFTFLGVLSLMFVSLIAGLIRMRYSKMLVGILALIAVFFITFYTMLLFAGMLVPVPP